MVERFVSVSRATMKGTFVIGIIQGGLAGLAFWVLGIDGAFFWGTIMAVLVPLLAFALLVLVVAGVILLLRRRVAPQH